MPILDGAFVTLLLAAQPVETATQHAVSPTTDPFVAPPRHRGTWLVITGGASTAALTVTRFALSGVILRSGLCYRELDENIDACEEDLSDFFAIIVDGLTPGFAVSLGLLGGGLSWMGRWQAYEDLSMRRPLRRNMKLRARLGWALLGTGLAAWTTSIAVGWHCEKTRNPPCFLGVHEGLFYGAAALTGVGMGLAPFAHGYDRQSRTTTAETVRWTPAVGPGYTGFSLAGRF